MLVGLFIPCYIDQLYPQVGMATVEVLERLGVEIDYPQGQTCCGQPMANTGCVEEARPLAVRFFKLFQDYEYVVCPSGSCTSQTATWKSRARAIVSASATVAASATWYPSPSRNSQSVLRMICSSSTISTERWDTAGERG